VTSQLQSRAHICGSGCTGSCILGCKCTSVHSCCNASCDLHTPPLEAEV
jgi:hypothetical protein